MKKLLSIVASIYIATIFFMPKEQLLYTLLNQTKNQNLNYKVEDLTDYGLFESIKKLTLYYDKGEVLEVDDAKLFPFLIYNKLSLSQLHLVGNFKSLLNLKVIEVSLSQNIFSPTTINIYANSTIGELRGDFNLKSNKLKVVLSPNDKFNNFKYKNYFKKSKEGYVYESIIKY